MNEGLPGAGKSYDAVATHIVPALKKGRNVYARLNGLNVEAIAAYIGQTPATVASMLHHVEPQDVHKLADLVQPDSLVVIDECHEFYVADRAPLPKDQERFFAMHRHAGLDIVLITQFYKRVHGAVRARIEQKNLYRKMTALGMNNRYVVSFMAAVSPDKFEKTGSDRRKYDPAIFALYKSVQTGTENLEVYGQGGKKVWEGKLGYITVIMVFGVIWGVWNLLGFYHGDGSELIGGKPAQITTQKAAVSVGASIVSDKAPAVAAKPKREPPIQYVLDLLTQARPRVGASVMNDAGKTFGIVEWVDTNGRVLERLTYQQLRDLGWAVSVRSYGIEAQSQEDIWIATNWPRDFGGRYTEQDQQRIKSTVTPLPSVSEPRTSQDAMSLITTSDYHPAVVPGPSSSTDNGQFRRPAR